MPFYETVFIARQDLSDAQVKALTEACEKTIKDGKGKITKTEQWGLRTLAYKINKARKAHYTLIEMETAAPALHEMERQMRIHDDVVRYLSISREEFSKGPSTIIDKNAENETYSREEEAA